MHPVLAKFFKKDPQKEIAQKLYLGIVAQSRQPGFFVDGGVADSVDGRFDILVINAFLVIRRLNQLGPEGKALAQHLFDDMFSNLDGDVREMGFSDWTIGKKIQRMAEAFYGRAEAYQKALDDADGGALKKALERNVYRSKPVADANLAFIQRYFEHQDKAMADVSLEQMLSGEIPFAPLSSVMKSQPQSQTQSVSGPDAEEAREDVAEADAQ